MVVIPDEHRPARRAASGHRDKLACPVEIAVRRRNIDPDRLERMISSIVRQLETSGDGDVTARETGDLVMAGLKAVDGVAWVRFAPVYRDFREVGDFGEFIGGMGGERNATPEREPGPLIHPTAPRSGKR